MVSAINGTANRFETVPAIGKAKGKIGRPRKQAEMVTLPTVGNYRQWLTCGMGCIIPILSLLLSHSAGLMLAENCCTMLALGLATLGVCCTLLALSLLAPRSLKSRRRHLSYSRLSSTTTVRRKRNWTVTCRRHGRNWKDMQQDLPSSISSFVALLTNLRLSHADPWTRRAWRRVSPWPNGSGRKPSGSMPCLTATAERKRVRPI